MKTIALLFISAALSSTAPIASVAGDKEVVDDWHAIAELQSHSSTPRKFDRGIAVANREHLRFTEGFWTDVINDPSYPLWQRRKCAEQLRLRRRRSIHDAHHA